MVKQTFVIIVFLDYIRLPLRAACGGAPDDYLRSADAGKCSVSIRLHLSSASDTIGHAIFIAWVMWIS